MSAEAAVFYLFAAITVLSGAVVVLALSLIYIAFALLFTFFGVAGLYLLLGADFLAATQLLVYVGGILVLLLFGVMLTHKLYDLDLKSEVTQFVPGIIISVGLFLVLTVTALRTPWAVGAGRAPQPTTRAIGQLFMKQYLLPVEAASVLLLVALMGAAMIVRRRKEA